MSLRTVLSSKVITQSDDSRGVKRLVASVCLRAVSTITQKRMIPKCSNLVHRMIIGYPTSVAILELKCQGYKVTKCKRRSNGRRELVPSL